MNGTLNNTPKPLPLILELAEELNCLCERIGAVSNDVDSAIDRFEGCRPSDPCCEAAPSPDNQKDTIRKAMSRLNRAVNYLEATGQRLREANIV